MAIVTVFGGTGFLGRRIVERFKQQDATVRVAVRHPERAARLFNALGGDQVIPVAADLCDHSTVTAAIAGAESVVNAVSAYVEHGGVTYTAVHVTGAGNVAMACQQQNAARLVHISGIGADPASASKYIQARGLGELAVREAFPAATILRPSVMFSDDGGLLSILVNMIRRTPIVPLIGGGRSRMQPVHVSDVAEATLASLHKPDAAEKTYDLGGPGTYTFREIVDMVSSHIGRRRRYVSIPFVLAYPLARILQLHPDAPLTVAQVDLLRADNLPRIDAAGLAELGITAQRLSDTISKLPRSA